MQLKKIIVAFVLIIFFVSVVFNNFNLSEFNLFFFNSNLNEMNQINNLNNKSLYKNTITNLFPTLLIGVMISDATAISRINAFRNAFKKINANVDLQLRFVKGKGEKMFEGNDIEILNINENINEGKTYYWFRQAVNELKNKKILHPKSGIVKMDIDTVVNWTKFTDTFFSQLSPNYYIGRVNTHEWCGGYAHCPPAHCKTFDHSCWVYMSGGWYALSLSLASQLILDCTYPEKNSIGYEDLMVGQWIFNCKTNISLHHVDNGNFFCHGDFVTDDMIEQQNYDSTKCVK